MPDNYYCEICNVEIKSSRNVKRHNNSKTHKNNLLPIDTVTKTKTKTKINIDSGLKQYIEFMEELQK